MKQLKLNTAEFVHQKCLQLMEYLSYKMEQKKCLHSELNDLYIFKCSVETLNLHFLKSLIKINL